MDLTSRAVFLDKRPKDEAKNKNRAHGEETKGWSSLPYLYDRKHTVPLASRIRPVSLEEFVGQQHLLGQGKMLRQLIEKDQISSMIFVGAAWVWESHSGQHHCRKDKSKLH